MKVSGVVQKGKSRGKSLGYPTANFALNIQIEEGIYLSKTTFKNQTFSSLTFIGNAKTFNEEEYLAENYILDFNEDLYDQIIEVELIKKIRANQKFNSPKELVEQIKKDEQVAREYFKNE